MPQKARRLNRPRAAAWLLRRRSKRKRTNAMATESPRRKLPKAKAPAVGKTSKPQDSKLKNNAESPESKAAEKVESAFEKKIGFSAESLKVLLTAKKPTPQIVKLKE